MFVGGGGVCIGDMFYDVQRAHERPIICVRIQPLHARLRRHCQHIVPQREAILGMVYTYSTFIYMCVGVKKNPKFDILIVTYAIQSFIVNA